MDINETTQALALAQAFDNRTVGEFNIRAWHAVLGDADAADVMAAIRDHYAEHTEWIMPAHIRTAVRDMVNQREMAARATGWAPGQYKVPKAQAMPEIAGPVSEGELSAPVRALLDSVRAMLPEGSRETLMPRRVAWEREHEAFVRTQSARPNPLYRPSEERECVVTGDGECQTHNRHVSSCPASGRGPVAPSEGLRRAACFDNGLHNPGLHLLDCPDA
jgi:hypothetical protein